MAAPVREAQSSAGTSSPVVSASVGDRPILQADDVFGIERIPGVVNGLRRGFHSGVLRTLASRRRQLVAMRRMLVEQEDRILDALAAERAIVGGTGDRATKYLAPTVLAGVRPDAAVMGEEIVGPILPVVAFTHIDEAIRSVNARDKPLALHAFSSSRRTLRRIVERTSSGGVALNHVVLQVGVPNLPFGGVGPSGMGAYNGEAGFNTYSHSRSVLTKPTRPDPPILFPPYTQMKQKLVRRLTPVPRGERHHPDR